MGEELGGDGMRSEEMGGEGKIELLDLEVLAREEKEIKDKKPKQISVLFHLHLQLYLLP